MMTMDEQTSIDLRRALDLLKAGDAENARPILVRLLKEDPNIEQAWYMLSFVVSENTKQKYALEQALRINPANQKARDRLVKLGGEVAAPAPERDDGEIEPLPAEMAQPARSSRDLFSQRMGAYGTGESEQAGGPGTDDSAAVEPLPAKKSRWKPKRAKKKKKKKAAKTTYASGPFSYFEKPSKKPRRILLIIVLIIIIIAAVSAFTMMGGGSMITDILESFVGDTSVPPEALPTPTPEGGGRQLPPTWTPTPTNTPTATPTPTLIPTATEPPTS